MSDVDNSNVNSQIVRDNAVAWAAAHSIGKSPRCPYYRWDNLWIRFSQEYMEFGNRFLEYYGLARVNHFHTLLEFMKLHGLYFKVAVKMIVKGQSKLSEKEFNVMEHIDTISRKEKEKLTVSERLMLRAWDSGLEAGYQEKNKKKVRKKRKVS